MRQRRAIHNEERQEVPAVKPLTQRIAEADLFPKPREDYQREQTTYGAVVSLGTVVFIALLVVWEGIAYLRGRDAYSTDITVDAGSADDMQVHVDILFPNLPCHRLSVDVIDAIGTQVFNYSGAIHKLPCGLDRRSMYKGTQKDLAVSVERLKKEGGKTCRKCPPSLFRDLPDSKRASMSSQCCDTCESVQSVFTEAGLTAPAIAYIPQCLERLSFQAHGCNVVGYLDLKKVPVTVVFGPRRTGAGYLLSNALRLDTSHIISKFRIGDESVERFSEHGIAEPLSGHECLAGTYLETRYVVNVVPTTYRKSKTKGPKATTYEYSAQWNKRAIVLGFNNVIPSVRFFIQPSALQVNNIFQRPPFTHFLVQLCGIVGGVFVVLGFVDRTVEWLVFRLKA